MGVGRVGVLELSCVLLLALLMLFAMVWCLLTTYGITCSDNGVIE
jgi:hypothetical protein